VERSPLSGLCIPSSLSNGPHSDVHSWAPHVLGQIVSSHLPVSRTCYGSHHPTSRKLSYSDIIRPQHPVWPLDTTFPDSPCARAWAHDHQPTSDPLYFHWDLLVTTPVTFFIDTRRDRVAQPANPTSRGALAYGNITQSISRYVSSATLVLLSCFTDLVLGFYITCMAICLVPQSEIVLDSPPPYFPHCGTLRLTAIPSENPALLLQPTSLQYSPFISNTLGVLFKVYVMESHEAEGGLIGNGNLAGKLPTHQVTRRIIDGVIPTLGPELQSRAFKVLDFRSRFAVCLRSGR
jgi:hypothetical protein